MTPFLATYRGHNAGLWLVAASLALALAGGCATPPAPSLADGRTTEKPNPIQVTVQRKTHIVHYASGNVVPGSAEIANLNDFLASNDAERGDAITIDSGPSPLDQKRGNRLDASLTRHGLVSGLRILHDIPAGELHLTLERYVAGAPGCPNWSKAPGNDFANTMPSDYGCSTENNLASMVADPRDLVSGRPLPPASGDAALAALHRYRTGKVLPLSDESAAGSAQASAGGAGAGLSASPPAGGAQ